MNDAQSQTLLQVEVVRAVVELHGQLCNDLFQILNVLILDVLLDLDLVGADSLLQHHVLLLVHEVVGGFLCFALSVLVHHSIVDKWLELFPRLHECHSKVVALNADLLVELVEDASLFGRKFFVLVTFLRKRCLLLHVLLAKVHLVSSVSCTLPLGHNDINRIVIAHRGQLGLSEDIAAS